MVLMVLETYLSLLNIIFQKSPVHSYLGWRQGLTEVRKLALLRFNSRSFLLEFGLCSYCLANTAMKRFV